MKRLELPFNQVLYSSCDELNMGTDFIFRGNTEHHGIIIKGYEGYFRI